MKNLKISKKMIAVALVNTYILSGLTQLTSYAAENEIENINLEDFRDIDDVVVARENEVAIMSNPDASSKLVGILEPGKHLKLIADCENYYEIIYKGKLGYVKRDSVDITTLCETNNTGKDVVTAKELTEIKSSPSSNSETIGNLRYKESLKVNGKKDEFYEVIYNDGLAYVDASKVEYKEIFDKMGYIETDSEIFTTSTLDEKVTDIVAPASLKIYDETENAYYIEKNGINGYIDKDKVKLFNGLYIVTDISDQITEMYNYNDLKLSTAVVTGMPPKHSTPTGIYYIGDERNEVTDHRDLIGEGYTSYVQYMMTFIGNRGIGYHSSQKGYDDRGRYFGWRDSNEYGGDTYLKNGSHGCVNMPNDAARTMYNDVYPYVVEEGNLVKTLIEP